MFGLNKVVQAAKQAAATIARHTNMVRREYMVEQYIRAGAVFGAAIADHFFGRCTDIKGTRTRWAQLERQYAAFGYRTIPLNDFIEIGAFGRSSDDLVRIFRGPGEEAILHAEQFQKRYATGFAPEFDLEHIMKDDHDCSKDKGKSRK